MSADPRADKTRTSRSGENLRTAGARFAWRAGHVDRRLRHPRTQRQDESARRRLRRALAAAQMAARLAFAEWIAAAGLGEARLVRGVRSSAISIERPGDHIVGPTMPVHATRVIEDAAGTRHRLH